MRLKVGSWSKADGDESIRLARLMEREVMELTGMGRVMAEKVDRVRRALGEK
jgi:hypothetical protein